MASTEPGGVKGAASCRALQAVVEEAISSPGGDSHTGWPVRGVAGDTGFCVWRMAVEEQDWRDHSQEAIISGLDRG